MPKRKIQKREKVFVESLKFYGFRYITKRVGLKKNKKYIISSDQYEDSQGVDFWIKLKGEMQILPIQITQRGVGHFKSRTVCTTETLQAFIEKSDKRLSEKKYFCKKSKILFVLIKDFEGDHTNIKIAQSDFKALKHALLFNN